MKKIGLMIFTIIIFAGCQKELADYTTNPSDPGNTGGNDSTAVNLLKGSWNFDSLHLDSKDSSFVNVDTFSTLTVTTLNYTSFGNNGTLIIDDSLFKFNNYTYSISTTGNATIYEDGVFVNNTDFPFVYYVPPANSVANYKLITSDSLYFPEGDFAVADTSTTSKPYGLTFKVDSTSLVFTQKINIDSTYENAGLIYHTKINGIGNLYFHKN